jgi:hypothetical protein
MSLTLTLENTIAKDDRHTTLPKATLDALDATRASGVYGNVDTYWNPPESAEFETIRKIITSKVLTKISGTYDDFRIRRNYESLERIAEAEQKMADNKEKKAKAIAEFAEFRNRLSPYHPQSIRLNINSPDYKEKNFAQTEEYNALSSVVADWDRKFKGWEADIARVKNWRPYRHLQLNFYYNDHDTDEILKELDNLERIGTVDAIKAVKKLRQMIVYRKAMMEEANKKRGNPMRSVELEINLTPMDFCARASWNIRREKSRTDYIITTLVHFLHLTEYNLKGADVVEYHSVEYTNLKKEKEAEEAKKKEAAEAKKKAKEDAEAKKKAKEAKKATKLPL